MKGMNIVYKTLALVLTFTCMTLNSTYAIHAEESYKGDALSEIDSYDEEKNTNEFKGEALFEIDSFDEIKEESNEVFGEDEMKIEPDYFGMVSIGNTITEDNEAKEAYDNIYNYTILTSDEMDETHFYEYYADDFAGCIFFSKTEDGMYKATLDLMGNQSVKFYYLPSANYKVIVGEADELEGYTVESKIYLNETKNDGKVIEFYLGNHETASVLSVNTYKKIVEEIQKEMDEEISEQEEIKVIVQDDVVYLVKENVKQETEEKNDKFVLGIGKEASQIVIDVVE